MRNLPPSQQTAPSLDHVTYTHRVHKHNDDGLITMSLIHADVLDKDDESDERKGNSDIGGVGRCVIQSVVLSCVGCPGPRLVICDLRARRPRGKLEMSSQEALTFNREPCH